MKRISHYLQSSYILGLSLGISIIAFVIIGYHQYSGQQVDQYRKKTSINFIGTSGSTEASLDVEIADTPYKQQYGLMFRGQIEWGDGMIFVFTGDEIRNFWMKNTYIPLDMIFVNSSGVVVSIYPGAKPTDETPISSIYPARYVVEANSGRALEAGVTTGVSMIFTN